VKKIKAFLSYCHILAKFSVNQLLALKN